MQTTLRLARRSATCSPSSLSLSASVSRANALRCMTTTASPAFDASASSSNAAAGSTSRKSSSVIPLSNVEAQWEKMGKEDKLAVYRELEEAMKRDWKELTIDEKKAAYYVSFGPHGPRAPVSKPGDNFKIFLGTMALVGVTGVLFMAIRARSPEPPHTMTKEWQEASNERALEQKLNPITGISSEGYKGPGFVQSK
ncbi:Cytochrome c oxidase subunit 5B, mitochondrial [Stygiomarasmius scandens]|uniref:Cytochrome c oxidase subunit 5B, mitochondrial n=1 Tax=Marasmiellus scandens TaxID=2682957 RepID=A0ABR1JDG4_9AGAR